MITLKTLSDFIRLRQQGVLLTVAVVTSVTMVIALLYFSDTNMILSNIGLFNANWYPVITLLFMLLILVVALRLFLSLHLSGFNNYVLALDASVLHIMLLNILPARLGDISYPFILKANLKIITSKSLANLIIIRLYDYVSIIILLTLSSWFYFFQTNKSLDFQVYLLAGIPVIVIFVFILRITVRLILIYLPKGKYYFLKKDIHDFLVELNTDFSMLNFVDHVFLLITTSLRWCVASLLFFTIFKGTGIDIDLNSSVLITTGINLSVIIPIQTIGGFGIAETVLAYFLGIFGYPVGKAIAIAISTRIIWLFILFSIGGVWLIFRKFILKSLKGPDSVKSATIQ